MLCWRLEPQTIRSLGNDSTTELIKPCVSAHHLVVLCHLQFTNQWGYLFYCPTLRFTVVVWLYSSSGNTLPVQGLPLVVRLKVSVKTLFALSGYFLLTCLKSPLFRILDFPAIFRIWVAYCNNEVYNPQLKNSNFLIINWSGNTVVGEDALVFTSGVYLVFTFSI